MVLITIGATGLGLYRPALTWAPLLQSRRPADMVGTEPRPGRGPGNEAP